MAASEIYAFGEFTLDATGRSLARRGAAIHLAPKAHDLLVALVRQAGRLLTKQELLAQVWPDAFVEEGILSVHVSSLRKALGGGNRGAAYIQTVARSGYLRALQISPNHTEAWLHYGSLMEALGKLEEGLQLKQQALERDPFSALVRVQIAVAYWHQRRYDEAIVWANKALDIDPKHLLAREFLAGAYLMTGNFDAFLQENITQAESFGSPPAAIELIRAACGRLKAAYARGGHAAVARCALDHAARQAQHANGSADLRFAVLHAQAGDLDDAFRWLDRALDSHDPSLVHLAVAPQWDGLRGDPRFQQRLARMGLLH